MRSPALLVLFLAVTTQAYKWRDCGVRYDRLHTTKLDVAGSMTSGSKVTVTASGTTNLHAPLTSGAWQVRIWETGVAKSTHTEFGDLMKAIKFNDPSKPTSFTLSVSFTLPAKQNKGVFEANLVALDQDKANYMCLDVDYSYPSTSFLAAVTRKSGCTSDKDCPSSYCQNAKPGHPGSCHGCGDACCETDKDCPGSYCANDPTKMPPYTCHDTKMAMTTESESEYCLHTEDKADHKCYEGCAASTFVNKGVQTPGPCPGNYAVTERSKVNDQCEDGVTNLRYCPGHDVNVTMKIKGLAMESMEAEAPAAMGYVHQIVTSPGDHCLEIAFPGGKSSAFWKADGWKYGPPVRKEWKTGPCDHTKWTSQDAFTPDYDGWTDAKNAPDGAVNMTKYGIGKLVQTLEEAPREEYCLHTEDKADHKCYEGCAASTFVNKGVQTPGPCPGNYAVTERSKVNDQCEDGVTNLRYCPGHQVNVTMKVKGLAMVEVLGAIPSTTPEYSIYCMKDPSKHPPYYCHVPPLPTSCKTAKDCVTPWYNSWCMNDSSKHAPFVCKQELPPTCNTDKDCMRP